MTAGTGLSAGAASGAEDGHGGRVLPRSGRPDWRMFLLFVGAAAVLVFLAYAVDHLRGDGTGTPAPPAGTGVPK